MFASACRLTFASSRLPPPSSESAEPTVVPLGWPDVGAGVWPPPNALLESCDTLACCGAVAVASPVMLWSIEPCWYASLTACASGLATFAAADASIGAATLRFAAAARSTGAARSSPRSTFAFTSSRDITSLFGSETASSASTSSIDTGFLLRHFMGSPSSAGLS